MQEVSLNSLMWTAIHTAITADYPQTMTKEEREEAEKKKTLDEFRRLKAKYGYK